MDKQRFGFFTIIIVSGIILILYLYTKKISTPYSSSLAPFYQLLGKPVKAVDRAFTRIIPIDQLDEKELGLEIKRKYNRYVDKTDPDYIYLNDIMSNLQPLAKKPFMYTIYPVKSSQANAFALPGGVICVTTTLLEVVKSEAELVSIILHEMGHIERSHCFDHVRTQLLSKKIADSSSGKIVDLTLTILLRHTYSKTIEDEADQHAHTLLVKTKYNPSAQAGAFERLLVISNIDDRNNTAGLIRDYLQTHPGIKQRIAKWSSESNKWWHYNKSQRRYNGHTNLLKRISFFSKVFNIEWSNK